MTTSNPVHALAAAAAASAHEPASSTIDAAVEIEGRVIVRSTKPLVIFGAVNGAVESEGSVVVAEGGSIRGPVTARHLEVAGSLDASEGKVEVAGLLAMRKSGAIRASVIAYGELEQERGARLNGMLTPLESSVAAEVQSEPERARSDVQLSSQAAKVESVANIVQAQPPAPEAPSETAAPAQRPPLQAVVSMASVARAAPVPPAASAFDGEPETEPMDLIDNPPQAVMAEPPAVARSPFLPAGAQPAQPALLPARNESGSQFSHEGVHIEVGPESLRPLPALGGR